MATHPILVPGLVAFSRGDYAEAKSAWEEPWKTLEGEERELAFVLVLLAGALQHQRDGQWDFAVRLYGSVHSQLAGLPAAVLGLDVERLRRDLPHGVEVALGSPPRLKAAPRVPRHLVVRFAALVVIVLAGFVVLRFTPLAEYVTLEKISALFERLREIWWAPLALLAAYVILCPLGVPATPLMITGGVVFGLFPGAVYNVVGTWLGGAATYFMGRFLGRDFVVHLVGNRLKKVERALARRGFWSLVGARFVPLPFPVVNYGMALGGIRPGLFLVTTALGLTPGVTLFTYFASAFAKLAGPERSQIYVQFAVATLLLLLLTVVPQVWVARKRKERYRQIRDTRAQRGRVD